MLTSFGRMSLSARIKAAKDKKVAKVKPTNVVHGSIDRSVERRTVDSFLLNSLEQADYEHFVNFYALVRKKRAGYPRMADVYDLTCYMAECNRLINAHMSAMRYVLLSPDVTDPSVMEGMFRACLDQELLTPSDADAVRFSGTMGIANNAIIAFEKNGDVRFDLFGKFPSDASDNTAGLRAASARNNTLPFFKDDEARNRTDAATLKAYRAYFEYLQKALFGGLVGQGTRRVFAIHDNSFDFSAILSNAIRAFKAAGGKFSPTLPTFPELPKAASMLSYLRIICYFEPDSSVRHANLLAHNGDDFNVSDDFMLMSTGVCMTYSMHLPRKYAEFVSQCGTGQPRLASLNTWINAWCVTYQRPPRSTIEKSFRDFPLYILSASALPRIDAKRKELGLYQEPGRVDEGGLTINPRGGLSFVPKASQVGVENAKAIENITDDVLQACFDSGTCYERSNSYLQAIEPKFADVRAASAKLQLFGGSLQAVSWDYNCALTTVQDDASRTTSANLAGSSVPRALNMSIYLNETFAKSMCNVFNEANISVRADGGTRNKRMQPTDLTASIESLAVSSPFVTMFNLYAFMHLTGKAPSVQELLKTAAKQLGLTTLDSSALTEGRAMLDRNIYTDLVTANLTLIKEPQSQEEIALLLSKLFSLALVSATGAPKTTLWAYAQSTGEDVADTPYFLDAGTSSLADIKNVFEYLGGRIVFLVASTLNNIIDKDVKSIYVVDPNETRAQLPSFAHLSANAIPMVKLLAHYIPKKEEIDKQAEIETEALQPDPNFDVSELKLPGFKDSFQVFPHQAAAFGSLSKFPRFCLLDVAPGGGKTTVVLADIANCVSHGKIKRPVVLCPNNLVKDWCAELVNHTEGRWNAIACVSSVYTTKWGDERLTRLIQAAPVNTIIVVGYTVLSSLNSYKYKVVIGNHAEQVSETLEFVKKLGPDYIALDESHRTKRFGAKKTRPSFVHTAAKALTTMSCVKYVRLATGSFIYNNMADAVGQTALMTAQVFRTLAEYEDENKVPDENGRGSVWLPDTPLRARKRLARFASVVSAKRRDWAFMLPIPIETFVQVSLPKKEGDVGFEALDPALRLAHQACYDAVLNETFEEIRGNPALMNLLKGKASGDDDDGDGDGDDDDSTSGSIKTQDGKKIDIGDEGGEENQEALESALAPYLQRLECILTDPLNDADKAGNKFGEIYFNSLNASDFVSNVADAVYKRLKVHFDIPEFKPGASYSPQRMVTFGGDTYIARPDRPLRDPEFVATKDPKRDTDNWKAQTLGKVIIFCRYVRSVDAIYRSMPAEFKKMAVRYHGSVNNAAEKLDAFKKDDAVKIIVATEMSISEGHNMQMASRIIRVESPWAPGELDQAMSRIFRPDPKNKFQRETIFLDWIITNNTLAVAKLGRLISKIIVKTQFDEATNPNYAEVMTRSLPQISMSLDNIREINRLADIEDYLHTYADLSHIQSSEFLEMRRSRKMSMLACPGTPVLKEFGTIEFVPYAQGQQVYDRHNVGIVRYMDFVQNLEDADVRAVLENPKTLIGQFAHTEYGNGVIESVRMRRAGTKPAADDDDEDNSSNGVTNMVSRVTVRLANGDAADVPASLLYLARSMTSDKIHMFGGLCEKADDVSRSRAKKTAKLADEAIRRDSNIRNSTTGSGRTGGTRTPRTSPTAPAQDAINLTGNLYAAIYNGFWALEAEADEVVDKWLKKTQGFDGGRDYLYVGVKNGAQFDAILAHLNKSFTLNARSLRELEKLRGAFTKTGRNMTFKPELAPVGELPQFFTTRHRMADGGTPRKPALRPYGVVLGDKVMIAIDIATNPACVKLTGKLVPGATPAAKFMPVESLACRFFRTRVELVEAVRAMQKSGFVISNKADLSAEITSLKPIAAIYRNAIKKA